MPEHAVIENESSIYYSIEGSGHNVILLHGFGEDSAVWNTLKDELSKQYRLIIPDLPGSGRSVANTDGTSMEKLADSVKTIVDKEMLESYFMIGHSMGGYITLAFAEKYPGQLLGIGLFHSTAYPDSDEKKETRKKNMDFIRKNGSEKFIQQSTPNLFADETKQLRPELVQSMVEKYRSFSPTALVNYTAAMMERPDRSHVLKTIKKPVLFIMGEHDTAVPLEQGLKQCSIPEFSYIYICVHSGHLGMLEEPEFCLKAVQDFLSAK